MPAQEEREAGLNIYYFSPLLVLYWMVNNATDPPHPSAYWLMLCHSVSVETQPQCLHSSFDLASKKRAHIGFLKGMLFIYFFLNFFLHEHLGLGYECEFKKLLLCLQIWHFGLSGPAWKCVACCWIRCARVKIELKIDMGGGFTVLGYSATSKDIIWGAHGQTEKQGWALHEPIWPFISAGNTMGNWTQCKCRKGQFICVCPLSAVDHRRWIMATPALNSPAQGWQQPREESWMRDRGGQKDNTEQMWDIHL